jgi:hypothetical protein
MEMDREARKAAMQRLEPFVGEWTAKLDFERAGLGEVTGRTTFEWMLDGQFLRQSSEAAHPQVPDSVSIVSVDAEQDAYTQHYFDVRGVVRHYAMTFADGVWTLARHSRDFSELSFGQRFTGTFSDDGDVIDGRWEIALDGPDFELDVAGIYTRVA